jgi:HPt (histidine-containing phosphotransfer) domain-containing protein
MATDEQTALSAALDRMWIQFLPQMRERADLLEAAARSLAAGKLSVDQHQAARSAAHKLAGILGTFGLPRATDLARELETMYAGPNKLEPALAERLSALAAEIRTIIESRQ